MTRNKVKLSFIVNDSSRKATCKKRKKGLMKKINELSTLCGIDACAIIYSPYEDQPEVWPNNIGVQRVLARFKRMPEMEQSKKMLNQESFIGQRIAKTNEQLVKQINENRKKVMTEVMYHCLSGEGSIENLSLPDLNDLGALVDRILKDVRGRIESLKKANTSQVVSAWTAPPFQVMSVGQNRAFGKKPVVDDVGAIDGVQSTQLFTDWINWKKPVVDDVGAIDGVQSTQLFTDWINSFG